MCFSFVAECRFEFSFVKRHHRDVTAEKQKNTKPYIYFREYWRKIVCERGEIKEL